MKTKNLYFLLLLLPFMVMVSVNEVFRLKIKSEGYKIQGVAAINSALPSKEKCSWKCHNDTEFCKIYHVELMKNSISYTDFIYSTIIKTLQSTGQYKLANILILVILLPGIMYYLLISSIRMQKEINSNKKRG